MALGALTQILALAGSTTSAASHATAAASTPTAGGLLVAAVGAFGTTTGLNPSLTDDRSHTWERFWSGEIDNGTQRGYGALYLAQYNGGGAPTFTFAHGVTLARVVWWAGEITGQNTSDASGVSGADNTTDAGGAIAVTLSGTPATSSTVVALAVGRGTLTIGEDATYTQIAEGGSGGTNQAWISVSHDAGSADNTIAWTGGGATFNGGVAVEILEAAAGGTGWGPLLGQFRNRLVIAA